MNIEWDEAARAWRVQAGREEVKKIPRALCRWDGIRRCLWVPELAWRLLEVAAGREHGHLFVRYHLQGEANAITPAPTARPLLGHQFAGVSHLVGLGRAGLFDDMGTGKSSTVIAAYHTLRQSEPDLRLLVLCPKRVMGEWINEMRLTLGREWDGEREMILNYDKIWRQGWALGIDAFMAAGPTVMVLDECHTSSGVTSRRGIALDGFAGRARYVWALSGTPVRNKPESFFPVYKIISGAAVTLEQFIARFCHTSMGRITGYRNLPELEAVTQQYCLRREVHEVMTLPPLTEQVIHVPLVGRQKRVYNDLANGLRAIVGPMGPAAYQQAMDVRVKVNQLVMAASHPSLIDEEPGNDDCAKLEMLDELLAEAGDQKVLVWSRYPRVLERIAARVREHGGSAVTMHGANNDKDNEANKQAFLHDPAVKVCCLSLGAFGEGLNLQCATIAIYHDLYWMFDKFHQSQRRLWRTGQTKPVHIYYLLGKNTIEEYVLETLRAKEQYQKAITGSAGREFEIPRAELLRSLGKGL